MCKNLNVIVFSQSWIIRSTILCFFVATILAGCDQGGYFNPLRLDPILKRGPYVQAGDTDSILVVWQTWSETRGAVEFGLTDELGTTVLSSEIGTKHSVALTGLQPNTDYYYRVLDRNAPISQIVSLHTNHESSDSDFSFLVIGDSGSGTADMFDVADLVNTSGASFGLHTGDVIYPNGEEHHYDSRFFYPYAWFLATNVMYMSLGNHDVATTDGVPYLSNFHLPVNNPRGTEHYYSFDYGQAHFVALDSNQGTAPSSTQYTWLEKDLANSTQPWKFVFFHHPPYTAGFAIKGGTREQLSSLSVRRNLVPLFERHGVDIVFSGHTHSYERTFPMLQNQATNREQDPDYISPHGPIYVVTGGGGSPLLGPDSIVLNGLDSSPLNARALIAYHIVKISLSHNELIGRAISPGSVVIDEFRIMK